MDLLERKRKQWRRKDLDFRNLVRTIFKVTVSLAVIFIIALVQFFHPLLTLLRPYAIAGRDAEALRLHFLSVGQGDCTVVEFPDGSLLVVDAGDGSRKSNEHIVRYLKGLNARSPLVLATHADADHCGGLAKVVETFGAETLYLPTIGAGSAYARLLDAAEKTGCERGAMKRYDAIARAGVSAVCVSPYSAGETDDNDASTVLFLQYGDTKILLCGDISTARELRLAAEYALDETMFDSGEYRVRLDETDILKVAHHGSASSSCDIWLDLIRAETAIVSCGQGNAYSHPAGETLERLAYWGSDIYRTDELGDIMVTVSPDGTYRTEYGYLK